MCSWVILPTPLFPGPGHSARSETFGRSADSVAWQFDLRSVGYTGFAPKKEQWGLHLRPNPLSFPDSDVLIATFITQERVPALARRDKGDEVLPLKLHAALLNVRSGELHATKEWSVTRPRGGIIPAGEGRFTVLTPSGIALYSREAKLLKELKLSFKEQSGLWDLRPSPSGKTIMIEYHTPAAYYEKIAIDSLTSQPASIPTPVFSISDTDIAIRLDSTSGPAEIRVQTKGGPWQTICRTSASAKSCGTPQFVSNDLLALQSPHGLTILPNGGGPPLLKAEFRRDEWLVNSLYPSQDGKRLAVAVWAHKGGSALLDISSHAVLKRVDIYDIPNARLTYTFDAQQHQVKYISGLALSQDGSLMAILTDGIVKAYRIRAD